MNVSFDALVTGGGSTAKDIEQLEAAGVSMAAVTQELEDEGEIYENIEDIWPDYPSQEDFMFNEDEY
jgi:hypothetical protein